MEVSEPPSRKILKQKLPQASDAVNKEEPL
jgi:hypothetical protein